MIAYSVVGLLFVLVVLFAVLARKQWHWVNILFVILTFISGTAACIGLSSVLDQRNRALAELEASEVRAAEMKKQENIVINGGYLPDDDYQYSKESLRGTSEALSLELIGQGRVWMNGSIESKGDNFLFKFRTSRDAADPTFGKLKNVLLYVFADSPVIGDVMYPTEYLGSFRVAEELLESLELAPDFVVRPESLSKPTTWSLFEKMPIDRNEVFLRANNIEAPNFDRTQYRSLLTNDILPAAQLGLDPESKEYEAIIDSLAFDGMTTGEIENWIQANAQTRKNMRFDPAPEEIFVQYRFEEKSKRAYQVDASGTLDVNGLFSPLGQAYDQKLHFGKEISLEKGDVVLIDRVTAEGYQRFDQTAVPAFSQLESVTEIGRIYRRKLFDFPYLLTEYRREAVGFDKHTSGMTQQNELTQKALDDTEAQVRNRDDIIVRLEQDRDNLKNDAEQITALLQQRSTELEQIRQRINGLQQDLERVKQKVGSVSSIETGRGRLVAGSAQAGQPAVVVSR